MDDVKLAMLGNKEAAKRLTEAGVLCQKLGLDYYIKDSFRKEMEAQP